jgi:hypothetical protein
MAYFDRVWRSRGASALRREFVGAATRDRARAAKHLNSGDATFPVLYLLMPELDRLGLYRELSARNIYALRLAAKKTGERNLESYLRYLQEMSDTDAELEYLTWMVDTGADWDGPSAGRDSYDAVIDLAVALLAGTWGEGGALARAAELIFRRNRAGLFIHDLVWGFFRDADAETLSAIAKYILSKDMRDVELACRLLGLDIPEAEEGQKRAFEGYTDYLRENRPFLYITGENFQATSAPSYIVPDVEAKYLRREISPKSRAPITPLTDAEMRALDAFREAEEEERVLLSEHSGRLKNRDGAAWEDWINADIARQVMAAREGGGEPI